MSDLRPPGTFLPPTQPAVHGDTRSRVRRDESKSVPPVDVPMSCLTVVKTGGATITTGASQVWSPWFGAVWLQHVSIWVVSPEEFTVAVWRGTEAPLSYSETGDGLYRYSCNERFSPGEQLRVRTSGDINELCVQLWFRGNAGGGLVINQEGGDG